MSTQNWILWLEQGRGARGLQFAAVALSVAALSFLVAFKQFHGPRTEETVRQALLGRSLAEGRGFTSAVNYPQVDAVMTRRGILFSSEHPLPELYHAPGYAVVIGGVLAALPAEVRTRWFATAPNPPDGFAPDYLLLGLNVVLLWVSALLTWRLGAQIFDETAGAVAALALLLSMPVWAHTVAVDGTPLVMVWVLGLFTVLARLDQAIEAGRRGWGWWVAGGVLAGLAFLTDYPLGLLLLVLLGFGWWRGRVAGGAVAVVVALLVVTPWLGRNVQLTGSPVALAAQDLALRVNDPTADPEVWRTTLAATAPTLSLNKLGNKVLTALQETLEHRLWSGGGLLLTAFFVTGWIYRFRRAEANRLRSLFALTLALLVVGQGLMNSGEGERLPTVWAAPLIMVFGVGFFGVLVASSEALRRHPRWAAAALLAVQALPLVHDLAEPRRIHFSYPPYYPGFFLAMGQQVQQRPDPVAGWMADVPAGVAWYSGQRVWAQPHTLQDFYAVYIDQRVLALVLTPATLDRPFFAELLKAQGSPSRFGDWGRIYTGLVAGNIPRDFPLRESQRLAENFQLLLDPRWTAAKGK